jgi:hypothetical protein
MPFPADAEARTVESEAQGIGASIVNFFRSILDHILGFIRFAWAQLQNFIQWAHEHPQAALLFLGNMVIFFS